MKISPHQFRISLMIQLVLAINAMLFLCGAAGAEGQPKQNPENLISLLNTLSGHITNSTLLSLEKTADKLQNQFDAWLKDPPAYSKRALTECRIFPEGRVYPFCLPAMAYCNLGLKFPEKRSHAAERMQQLIDSFIPVVIKDIRPPKDNLLLLDSYAKEGTYLATLNFVLANYEMIAKDRRYHALHQHIAKLLLKALKEAQGGPIASYPNLTWYFDTLLALVSLHLQEQGLPASEVKTLFLKHQRWLQERATDPKTGLPYAFAGGQPAGCDLSMQICLMLHIDPKSASLLYKKYTKHHWRECGVIAGFSEYPNDTCFFNAGDIDSGPILFGIGLTATGVGLGAALAMNDTNRLTRLAGELELIPSLQAILKTFQGNENLFGGSIRMNPSYTTGFLYGDAVLFYALTWTRYPGISYAD